MSSDEKPTVEIAAVPDWAVKLTEKVVGGFGAMTTRLDKQDEVLERVANESIDTNTRLAKVEMRIDSAERKVGDLEERLGRTSTGVKGLSSADSKHESDLAAEILKNQERDRKIEETHALAAAAAQTLKEQSDFMGMGKRGATWLVSKEGRTVMAQLGAAIVCAYEFFKHSGIIK